MGYKEVNCQNHKYIQAKASITSFIPESAVLVVVLVCCVFSTVLSITSKVSLSSNFPADPRLVDWESPTSEALIILLLVSLVYICDVDLLKSPFGICCKLIMVQSFTASFTALFHFVTE